MSGGDDPETVSGRLTRRRPGESLWGANRETSLWPVIVSFRVEWLGMGGSSRSKRLKSLFLILRREVREHKAIGQKGVGRCDPQCSRKQTRNEFLVSCPVDQSEILIDQKWRQNPNEQFTEETTDPAHNHRAPCSYFSEQRLGAGKRGRIPPHHRR